MDKIDNSLRRRLIQANFGMTLLVSVIFGTGILLVLDAADDLYFDRHIASDVRTFMAQYEVEPEILDLPRENFTVYVAEGGVSDLPADLQALAAGADELVRAGRPYDVLTEHRGTKTFYFLFDETVPEYYERTVLLIAALTVSVIFVVAFGLSTYFSNRIIQPVTTLTRRVLQLDEADDRLLAVDPNGPKDELYHLATSVNGYLERIRGLLRREREFSSDVAHELRTPLMGIQGAAENLARKVSGDDGAQALTERIRRRCAQMTTLIDALLHLARDAADAERAVTAVSVTAVVDEQVSLLRDIAHRRGVEVNVHRNHERAPRVMAIQSALSVVLGNLLKNAVTHTNQAKVDVYLTGRGVTIQDYGPGVDPAFQVAMFERFTRGDPSYETGAGIGLSLVRRFCDLHHWRIDVSSQVDAGTRIALRFS